MNNTSKIANQTLLDLLAIVKLCVRHPLDLHAKVSMLDERRCRFAIVIEPHYEDVRLMVGRSGINADAFRMLVRCAADKQGCAANLYINAPSEHTPPRDNYAPQAKLPIAQLEQLAELAQRMLGARKPAAIVRRTDLVDYLAIGGEDLTGEKIDAIATIMRLVCHVNGQRRFDMFVSAQKHQRHAPTQP